jgi:hypothetical protein
MGHLRYHVKKVFCYIFFMRTLTDNLNECSLCWKRCLLFMDVVSFYNTVFNYECCHLLHYFAMDVVSFYNIYYGCYLLLLQYFTMDFVSFYNILLCMLSPPFTIFYYGCCFLYNILYGCCLLGFYSFLYRCCLFLLRSDNRSIATHTVQLSLSLLFFLCRCISFLTKTMSREELTLLNFVSLFLLKRIII